jgi:hypothetical protein
MAAQQISIFGKPNVPLVRLITSRIVPPKGGRAVH